MNVVFLWMDGMILLEKRYWSSLSSGGDSVRGKGRFERPQLASSGNKGVVQ